MKALFWEIAARLGFWIPCNKYLPNNKYWDWVLISLHERGLSYRYVPHIAEYVPKRDRWNSRDSDYSENEFLNEMCEVTHWHKIPNDRFLKIK